MTRVERNHDRAIISLCRNALVSGGSSHDTRCRIKIARSFEFPFIVKRIDGHSAIGCFFNFRLCAKGHTRVLLRFECAVGTFFGKIDRVSLLLA